MPQPSIKKFRTNNAQDYSNQCLHIFFQQEGIAHESSCVDTHQQNGVAERKMRHFSISHHLSYITTMFQIFFAGSCFNCWPLHKLVPSKLLKNQRPFLSIFSFSRFWSRHFSFFHIHKQHRNKFDSRAPKCNFLGYSNTQKGYKYYYPPSRNSISLWMSHF